MTRHLKAFMCTILTILAAGGLLWACLATEWVAPALILILFIVPLTAALYLKWLEMFNG